MLSKNSLKQGISLVEVVVATAIILTILSGLYGAHIYYLKTVLTNLNKVKSSFLLEEGVEAVKLIRDQNWTNISTLATSSTYYLSYNSGLWKATTTNTFVDGVFERKFVTNAVNRNVSGDIVTSGGTNDIGTKKVTVTISWNDHAATTSKSLSTYITNIINQ